jgi:hypothetical protein
LFFSPDFFVPIVNQEQFVPIMNREQVEAGNDLNTRGRRWVFMAMGHLKAGITPAQAIADLNSIGSYLEKTYPKDDGPRSFKLCASSSASCSESDWAFEAGRGSRARAALERLALVSLVETFTRRLPACATLPFFVPAVDPC